MARLTKAVLGELSGKIGSLIVRKVNGKQFVSLRPDHYKKSKSSKAIYEKNKFSAVVKFAKTINSIPHIKNVWQKSNVQGFSTYHKILKTNLKLFGVEKSSPSLTIFPHAKNNYSVTVTVTGGKISILFDEKLFQAAINRFESTLNILRMINVSEKHNKDYYEIRTVPITVNSFCNHCISIEVNELFGSRANNYSDSVFYVAVLLNSLSNKKVSWTDTVSYHQQ
ncbi:MAG: hypothetical protein M1495_14740 [Bacteroidetes bacterium]|nr:hypothetical protein [Bacteroidota bacterium]